MVRRRRCSCRPRAGQNARERLVRGYLVTVVLAAALCGRAGARKAGRARTPCQARLVLGGHSLPACPSGEAAIVPVTLPAPELI
jgi:hypothetical protein